ncbi:probable N-acetyltransferase HLS1 [Impatiens glandulifera]|uniref:probable N-acetyltransferase HLS1 n=1 Tax=Impatiens glandulifera TaxID=253017 RepID=UPI001FB168DB|nr:probable N-acetyltransferase HLS1 [Impatiens glandulifera]
MTPLIKRLIVREFDPKKDRTGVEEIERRCSVGKLSILTDLMGDPICRIRHSPAFLMLVAEMEICKRKESEEDENYEKEIVGMIRGSIKTVTRGKKPQYTKLASILGLRVSPSHRRMRIGLKLVEKIEEWFRENGAEYSYIATEIDNHPSVKLFTEKCNYSKFRTPSILVQPVFAHSARISNRITIIKIGPSDAESLYRRRFSTTEFFPKDIDAVLNNKQSLGTFVAVPRGGSWPGSDHFLDNPPESWAVMSIWNCQFQLEVHGVSRVNKGLVRMTRIVDRVFPWLRVPSVPELFKPFGVHFLYGIGGEGPLAVKFVKGLCGLAHNLAMNRGGGGGVVVTEVAACEPLKKGIPHWKRLSCAEDLWCLKRLEKDNGDGAVVGDWTISPPGMSIFVDPREV